MAETTRKVRYLMSVEVDPQAQANASKLAALVENAEKEKTRTTEEESKKREETERQRIEKINAEIEKQAGISQRASREMHDGLLQAGEGAVTLIRGFAELGIVQKENAEQMLKGLIQIQAAVDLAKGGIEIYRGLASTVDAYRTSVAAATAAEGALAAARGRTAAAGNLGLAGNAASGLAVSGLSAGGIGSSVIGALGPALGGLSAAILSLPGAIALAIAGLGTAGAMAFNVGGIRDRAAEAIPEQYVDPESMGGWAAGNAQFAVQNLGLFGLGGMAASSGYFGDLSGAQDQYFKGKKSLEERGMMAAAGQQVFQSNNAYLQDRFDLRQQLRQMRFSGMASNGVDPREQLGFALDELQNARQASSAAEAMQPGQLRQEQAARAAQAEMEAIDRVIGLRRQSLAISQQETQERLAGVKEETSELQRQLAISKQQQQTAEDRLKTAKERFGGLDEATQRRLIAAKQKADSQGVNALNREERALLRGVGTNAASEIASQGDLAAADAAGFDNVFGGVERFQARAEAVTQARLEAKLKVQQEVAFKIETDAEKLADIAANRFDESMAEYQRLFEQALERRINQRGEQRVTRVTPGTTGVGG